MNETKTPAGLCATPGCTNARGWRIALCQSCRDEECARQEAAREDANQRWLAQRDNDPRVKE